MKRLKSVIFFLLALCFTIAVNATTNTHDSNLILATKVFDTYALAAQSQQSLCPSPAQDQTISNQIKLAYNNYLQQAKAGNAKAQYYVGLANLYMLPGGSIDTAYVWFEKSAAQNNALAMRQLGMINALGGIKIPQNSYKTIPIALQWFKKAVNAGDYYSLLRIGLIYYTGIGVKKNKHQFFILAERAANHRVPSAYFILGNLYFSGKAGVKQNYKLSLQAYQGALQGTTLPTKARLFIYYRLSYMYDKGLGTQKNKDKASQWLQKAKQLAKQKKCYLY